MKQAFIIRTLIDQLIPFLHTGQVFALSNQGLMQDSWKVWLHVNLNPSNRCYSDACYSFYSDSSTVWQIEH